MKRIRLFCFPYAGGSASIFNKWKKYLDEKIQLTPIELAGRGKRINDPFYKDIADMIDDVYDMIDKKINGESFAFFGHSMGGMISYELSQKLKENGDLCPLHVFFSGRSAPHVKIPDKKKYHTLSEEDFKKQVMDMGGTPPEFFEHSELLELFLPLLKSDFKLAELDLRVDKIQPIDCDISVLFGKDEDLSTEEREGWKKHTKASCDIHYFDGGHFFLNDETEQVVDLVNSTLLRRVN